MKTKQAQLRQSEIEQALVSPTTVFELPEEVVKRAELTRDQKVEILKRWAADARALQIATEENMSGGKPSLLDEVNAALSIVDPDGGALGDLEKAPTKL